MIFDTEFFDSLTEERIRMVIKHDGAGVSYCFSMPDYDLVAIQVMPYPHIIQLRADVSAVAVFGDKIESLIKEREKMGIAWG